MHRGVHASYVKIHKGLAKRMNYESLIFEDATSSVNKLMYANNYVIKLCNKYTINNMLINAYLLCKCFYHDQRLFDEE